MESPLRFQVAVAAVAVGGVLLVADGQKAPPSGPVLTFQDPAIDESSGLVDLGDLLLTVNDSGSDALVHVVDKRSGETVGRTAYAEDVVDVEALAAGPDGSVWVGDIGDNGGRRTDVAVYRLPAVTPGDRSVTAARYDLAYRGGPRDAEALLVHPRTGRVYVVSKGLFGGQVFAAPRRLSEERLNLLRPVADTAGMVTDGAFLPGGEHAVLRTYSRASFHDPATWTSLASLRLPEQPQGEGVAVPREADHLLVSTEGAGTAVLAVPLTEEVREALAPPAGTAAPPAGPGDPVAERREESSFPVRPAVYGAVALAGLLLVLRAARRRSRSRR